MKSIYIHIPFCKSICSYCDFCKLLYNKEWTNSYLEALSNEIESRYENEYVETLYIGGGTPSILNKEELETLFNIINKINKTKYCEFTFECNLNDINEELLSILKDNGVNRLSIGVESFNSKKLKFMERETSFKEALTKISLCRKYDFNNINVDLIYGTPEETVLILKQDIKKLLKLKVEHISAYSLIIEDNTKIKINNIVPLNDEIDSKMYEYICKKLSKSGYIHYEISNFALPGFESKHNLNYWNNNEYYGFGLGAHGYILGFRYENTRSLNDYLDGEYILYENIMSKKEDMDNEIMLGLRKIKGINLQTFYEKFKTNLQDEYDIKDLLKNKLLKYKDGYLYIPKDKLYLMNEILLKII